MTLFHNCSCSTNTEGSHHCGIFTSNDELIKGIAQFIMEGFAQNDKVFLIEDDKNQVALMMAELNKAGVNLSEKLSNGSLVLCTTKDSYMDQGIFSSERMVALFELLANQAKEDGFTKLRVTAEPTWIFCVPDAANAFLFYERFVNSYFQNSDSVALCAYCRERWSINFLLDILMAHPFAVIDGSVPLTNCYYIPPEESESITSATLKKWLSHLKERKIIEADLREFSKNALKSAQLKSQFLATMSHEMRTPLNGVIGMADILSGHSLSSEQKECVDIIRSSSNHLLSVINDVLDMACIDSGKLKLESHPTSIPKVFKNVKDICQTMASRNHLDLHFICEKNVPETIVADYTRLSQVLVNLVGNAIKFTRPKSTVTITAKLAGEISKDCDPGGFTANGSMIFLQGSIDNGKMVSFSVRDEGVGIPKEKLHLIFEMFTQADNTITRKFGGTGLGLAICQNITRLWGGDISVKSELGKFTEFTFLVPTIKLESTEKSESRQEVKESNTPETRIHLKTKLATIGRLNFTDLKNPEENSFSDLKNSEKKTPNPYSNVNILVAEDNSVNRVVIKKILHRIGCNVDLAENGLEAFEKAKQQCFDLIFMDIHMPVCDGFESSKLLKEYFKEKCPPIYVLTASAIFSPSEKERLQSLTNGLLLKPAKMDSYAKCIKEALSLNTEKTTQQELQAC